MGEKTEETILRGIALLEKSKGKVLLGYVLPIAQDLEKSLISLNEVERVNVAGSVRRMKETIGDIDILVVSKNPSKVIDYFTKMKSVEEILAMGGTKSSIRLKDGLQVDLRVMSKRSYGAALNYFTGSKEHNVALRRMALNKGLKLNEYGIFKRNKFIAGKDEKEVYTALGLRYIEPELRENTGEIEASKNNK
ncbi:DNA polymerase III, partial [Candidatus Woesearchaeota archaeon]|nr:DNA polymerase III [Candidatus Woesearchaeota archaeon]